MRSCEDYAFHKELFDRCSAMMLTINAMPQPVIAQVHGVATAGGCQLVAAADLAVASEDARFAASGINLGLFCSTPAVPLSRNLSQKTAMRMLLTGEFISARTALEWGLVNDVAPAVGLSDRVRDLARTIAEKSAYAVRLGKRLFYDQLELSLTDAYARTSDAMARNMGEETARGEIDAFLTKRRPKRAPE
ncbi:MAG: enoyl-CoA hydratase-related protein [Pseudomonadota bacterium]